MHVQKKHRTLPDPELNPMIKKKKEIPMFQKNPPIFWSLKTSHSHPIFWGRPLNAPQRLDSCEVEKLHPQQGSK